MLLLLQKAMASILHVLVVRNLRLRCRTLHEDITTEEVGELVSAVLDVLAKRDVEDAVQLLKRLLLGLGDEEEYLEKTKQ